ncbi:MAG: hypothetical protein GF403_03100, partial [Candidatus Coatesbacteria bacterium]|nr:hypothetical protein [Candidatus Coatesbacteria bacterium]
MEIKEAFVKKKHISIAKAILRDDYNDKYDEINSLMDRKGGVNHRYNHGHNKEMEDMVLEKYGEIGRQVFIIHILADRYLDSAVEAIQVQLGKIYRGESSVPYYDK